MPTVLSKSPVPRLRRSEVLWREIRPGLRVLIVLAGYLIVFPFVLLTAARWLAPAAPPLPATAWLRWPGLVLAAAGAYLFVRAWFTLAVIGKEWPLQPPVLLVSGQIYLFVRHPLYLGYTLAWTGWALWRASGALLALALGATIAWAFYALWVEEPRLLRRHGGKYADYRRRIPFIWPRWRSLAHGALALNLFLLLTMVVFRWLFRLIWRLKVEGQEHVPEEGAFVLVSNHVNLADPFLIGLFMTRQVRFMASDELFRKPLLKLLFGALWPAFPKRRWGRDIGALRQAERMLAAGVPVGIFPEGARNWDGGPVKVGDEVYRFIHHCRTPVLCASIVGGHEAMPRWASWPSFARVTIRFFPVIQAREAASATELRPLVERRIFACALEPPVPRAAWRSHRGLPTVAWGCLKCGAVHCMSATRTGIRCRRCGAYWLVTAGLELVEEESGARMLEREYHARLRERLLRGEMEGGLAASARVKAFRVVEGKLRSLAEGELVLDGQSLIFDSGEETHCFAVREIRYAFLNLRNHLVVSDGAQALEFKIVSDSPVRFEDYLGAARQQPLMSWQPDEEAVRGF